MLICLGCEWRLKSNDEASNDSIVTIERYDRIESLYLTTGDYSALLQMNKSFPMQTRTLIENVLQLGQVNDPEINIKFLRFFSDSTLQQMINDVQEQFTNLDDLNNELTEAFRNLKEEVPSVEMPQVYAQIGSFDQSIIVPSPDQQATQAARDWHRGKIQWVVNHVTNRRVFDDEQVTMVDSFMKQNKEMSVEQLLRDEKTY